MTDLPAPVGRRRTFAIISHPDAGKTTLTEKLLLFGGAIQLAGEVKAKKNRVSTRSDWMGIEKERGISVVTSVMTFEYGGCVFNLLDTPGHEDFSEDTYRTLTAVDSAIMVIDAAKGIEARTRKLFEVCRMRDIPIVTFINKMDREARNPFDLLDEIEKTLALDTSPVTWPISQGRSFAGTFDLRRNMVRRIDTDEEPTPVSGPDDQKLLSLLPPEEAEAWQEEVSLAQEACKPFDLQAFREGHLTPVFFGIGLAQFRRARSHRCARRICAAAARPGGRQASRRGGRAQDVGLRVQDPGQHGSEPPRPHRLHAHLLGQAPARHEGEARAHGQAHEPELAAILLRPGPRHRGRGLGRRRGRHSRTTARCASAIRSPRARTSSSAACRASRRKSCAASSCRTP